MDAEILKIVGQVAGIGGLGLGVFLLLYRNIIKKNIFPNMTKVQTYKLFKLIVILVFSIAVIGIFAWIYSLQFSHN